MIPAPTPAPRHREMNDMPLGEPFVPTEPEWLIRAQAGLPPIKKTSELPRIIPPLPTGDTKDLKVWREYWKQHDAQVAKAAREQVLDEMLKELQDNEQIYFSSCHDDGDRGCIQGIQIAISITESLRAQQGGVSE